MTKLKLFCFVGVALIVFSSTWADDDEDSCEDNPCKHGSCHEFLGKPVCFCNNQYYGNQCQYSKKRFFLRKAILGERGGIGEKCIDVDCGKNGECASNRGGYYCACTEKGNKIIKINNVCKKE